jgi:Na+/melibiose symporter-like transporter
MIITCKKEVPFHWMGFAILPWASVGFNYSVIAVVFFFSLKKFIDNPAGLTFILSLPSFISIVLQPVISFTSDRIWTRFGRRKPFIATSMVGMVVCLGLLPLMPNFWALLVVYMFYNAFLDLNVTLEPLKQEIVPPHERGRATGAMTWCSNLAMLLFYFVALGRFDDVNYIHGYPLRGETAIYWSGALLLVVMLLLITLGIRELDQKSALRGERLSLRTLAGGLLDRELWPVYLLVMATACLNFYAGLGPLSNLLYTEQWNYTKQEMGVNVAIGGIINLVAISVLTVFADKLNRMRTYRILICLSLTFQILYYLYVNYVLPDKHPSLIEIIVFGEVISILGILTNLVYFPLIYDYIRRNKMGTFNAGAQLVIRLTVLVTLNGVGLFVWAYAQFFQPPAGEMTRIVLRDEQSNLSSVLATLRANPWTYPDSHLAAPSSAISATAWQADGTVSQTGRAWEVRLHDRNSERLEVQKEKLQTESSPLTANEKMHRDQATILRLAGDTRAATTETQKAEAEHVQLVAYNGQIAVIDGQLSARDTVFHEEVVRALGGRMIADGEQITAAKVEQALVLELPANHRPDSRVIEKTLANLRHQRPDVIDLRPLKQDRGYGLAVSAIMPVGADQTAFAHQLQAAVEQAARQVEKDLLTSSTAPLDQSVQPALTLDLLIVEQPVAAYVSPITRLVNVMLMLFGDAPSPDRHLLALARNLRVPADTNHVLVAQGPELKSLAVTAVIPATAAKAASLADPVGQRLQALLGLHASAAVLAQSRAFYDRIETTAADQRITVARPTLTSAYAKLKYDYMSGYLWMFFMGSIGIGITFIFTHMERKGLIRKRGVEEALKS